MQFEEAAHVFSQLETHYPEHPAPYFLQGLNRWWESYVAPEMETYHAFILEKLDQAVEKNQGLKEKEKAELEYTFFQFMSYAFKSRLYILRKEWLKAANAGRKAFPYLKKGFQFQEDSPEFYFGSGIYHYYADEYPRTHPIVQPFMIFFPEASAEQGIDELRRASTQENFAQFEAAYYLGDIYLKGGRVEEGLALQRWLYQQCPHNTWFAMEYGRALVDKGAFEEAEVILRQQVKQFEQLRGYNQRNVVTTESLYTTYLMSRVYLWLGKGLVWQEKGQQAIDVLIKAEKMAELALLDSDDEYLPAIYFFLGSAYEQAGEREHAEAYYEKVLKCSQNEPYKEKVKKRLK